MNNESEKYFTTGEFAALFGINKKTLFHYDDIHLFTPKKISTNGYRYYCQSQIELFNVIMQLKRLNMPLNDIKEFIETRNEQMVIDLFSKKISEIDDEIENLKRIKQILSTKMTLIEQGLKVNDSIILETQKEELLILTQCNKDTKNPYDIEGYVDHLKYCFHNKYDIGYPIGCMVKSENIKKGCFFPVDYYFTKVEKKVYDKIHIKPSGLYVSGYIKGDYESREILYSKLMNYIKDNELRVDGCSYEEWIIDEIAVQDFNDFVIKISIKISSK